MKTMLRAVPLLLLLLLNVSLTFSAEKKPKLRDPEIQVLEITVVREEDRMAVDGRVRNVGEKVARRLEVTIEAIDSDGKPVARETTGIEGTDLEPTAEAEIHSQMRFPPRAVKVRLTFAAVGLQLKGPPAGPYPIE